MKSLIKYADSSKSDSLAHKFRLKRFKIVKDFLDKLPKPVKILDVGGTIDFWEKMDFKEGSYDITLLNIEFEDITKSDFKFIKGDVSDIGMFKDKEFDVVFSNSVIEHLGSYVRQKQMADEVRRTGKEYIIQTPNYYFPIEQHFLFPLYQFLPLCVKIFLLQHFNLGWFDRTPDKDKAKKIISSIRLLNRRELRKLFPDSEIIREKFFIFTKSFLIIKKRVHRRKMF